jgi:hypothetical protein
MELNGTQFLFNAYVVNSLCESLDAIRKTAETVQHLTLVWMKVCLEVNVNKTKGTVLTYRYHNT